MWSFEKYFRNWTLSFIPFAHTHIIPHTRLRITPIKISALLRRLKNTFRARSPPGALFLIGVLCFALFHDSREHALKSLSETGIIMLIMERHNAVTDQREINYSIPNHFLFSYKIVAVSSKRLLHGYVLIYTHITLV